MSAEWKRSIISASSGQETKKREARRSKIVFFILL